MATLLNTQNPLAAARWLWCPGGLRVKERALQSPSAHTWGQPGEGAALRLSPHQGEPIPHRSGQHGVHQLQPGPRGQPGAVEGALGAEVQVSPTGYPSPSAHIGVRLQGTGC